LPHDKILEGDKYQLLYTVEEVNKLVSEGVAFRDAYHMVSDQVKSGKFKNTGKELKHTHLGSIGNPGFDLIREKFKRVLNDLNF